MASLLIKRGERQGVFVDGVTRTYLKNKVRVQGKARSGAPSPRLWRDKQKNAAYTAVCKHFEPFRKAAMGT
jgi:hypothetical protein